MRTDRDLEDRALAKCKKAHAGQKRKYSGDPYEVHPIRVAEAVMMLPGATSVMVAAALLHDTIEDCGVTFKQLKEEFGADVAVLVLELTTPADLPGNRAERKLEEHKRLAGVSYEAKAIKMCDRYDNLTDMPPKDGFTGKYARETVGLLEAIGEVDAYGCEALKARLTTLVERLSR